MSAAREALAGFIRWVMRDVTYRRMYVARVEADHEGTVDLTPEADELEGLGLQRVPVRVGVAGARVRLERGTRCLVGFDDADPRRPKVVAWEYAADSAHVTFDGGARKVARVGDPVKVLVGETTAVQGIATGTLTIPGSPPTIVPVPGAPFAGFVTGLVPEDVVAEVAAGAPKLTA